MKTLNSQAKRFKNKSKALNIFMIIILCFIMFSNIESLKLSSLKHKQSTSTLNTSNPQPTTSPIITSQPQINLSTKIDYNKTILSIDKIQFSKASDINTKINKIQQSTLPQQQQIRLLANITDSTQFNSFNLQCLNISTNDLNSLLSRTSQMKKILIELVQDINFLKNQTQKTKFKNNLQNQIIYLNNIQKFLSSGCKEKINIKKTLYVSNPNAKNWILGDWTYHQFVNSYIQKINSNPSTNKCPLEKPFFNGIECIDCTYPNNVWDMKNQICSSCPYPLIVNVQTRKCISEIHYVNNVIDTHQEWITKELQVSDAFDIYNVEKSKPNAIVCPYATPFILNQKCDNCPQNQIYILEEKRCNPIPYNMYYDKNLHKVVKKLENYQTNKAYSNLLSQNKTQCPTMLPYFDTLTCINCVFPQFYNQRLKICDMCVHLQACGGVKVNRYITNLNDTNILKRLTGSSTNIVKSYIDEQNKLLSQSDTVQCASSQPFYSKENRKCINCPSTQPIFNVSTFKCVSCSLGSTYNQTTLLCQKVEVIVPNITVMKTNPNAPNLLIDNITKYQAGQNSIIGDICPLIKPYSIGKDCIQCNQTQLFNTTTKQCISCAPGLVYNKDRYICQKKQTPVTPVNYKNNPNATNLWISNLTQYQNTYQSSKNQSCPTSTPYSIGTKCISCQVDQIFNTTSKQCTSCPQGFIFNKTNFNCSKSTVPVQPISYKTNPNFTKLWISNVTNYQAKYNADKNQSCLSQTPYSIGTKCIRCLQNEIFNTSSLKCTMCPVDTVFDQTTFKCILVSKPPVVVEQTYISNLKIGVPPYYSSNKTDLLIKYQQKIKNGSKICPFQTPFFSGNQCIKCPVNYEYFNIDTKKCQNCSTGYKMNQIIFECQQQPPNLYTSLTSPNLVYSGQPIAYYKYKQQQVIAAGAQQCDSKTPYYTLNNKCQVCPSNLPYFDLLRRKCVQCLSGTTYNQTEHECVSPIGDYVGPETSLEKSLANLFV